MLAVVAGVAGDIVGLLVLISCIVVAVTARKKDAHDLLAICLLACKGAAFKTTLEADREAA